MSKTKPAKAATQTPASMDQWLGSPPGTPAPPLTTNTPAMPPEIIERVRRLVVAGAVVEIDIPPTLNEQKAAAVNLFRRIDNHGAQLGFLLHVVRAQMEHGEWGGWLTSVGLPESTARAHMAVAGLLAKLDETSVKLVQSLPLRRKLALAKLGPEAVDELVESGGLDDLAELPEKQFKAQVKELQALRARVVKLEAEINARDQKTADRAMRRLDHPELVHRCRVESVALAENGDVLAAEFERLCRALVMGEGLSGETDLARAQVRAAASPLIRSVMSIAGRLYAIAQGLRDELGDELVAMETVLPLTAEEIEEVAVRRQELKPLLIDLQRANHQAGVEVMTKRKRGRPAKKGK